MRIGKLTSFYQAFKLYDVAVKLVVIGYFSSVADDRQVGDE